MSDEDDFPAMTSHRPYLLRALYEWIADNGMTPHLLVDAEQPGVRVPPHAIKDGRVVLNVAERAVARLQMDNESVSFSARFGGVSYPIDVPMAAVVAIYARETGQGMVLPEDVGGPPADPEGDPATAPQGVPRSVDHDDGGNDDGDGPGPDSTPPRRGHLRVVK